MRDEATFQVRHTPPSGCVLSLLQVANRLRCPSKMSVRSPGHVRMSLFEGCWTATPASVLSLGAAVVAAASAICASCLCSSHCLPKTTAGTICIQPPIPRKSRIQHGLPMAVRVPQGRGYFPGPPFAGASLALHLLPPQNVVLGGPAVDGVHCGLRRRTIPPRTSPISSDAWFIGSSAIKIG